MELLNSLSPQVTGWLVLAVVLLIVEALTAGLVSIWLAGGALAAAATGLATDNFFIQLVVFVIVSLILLVLTRPLAHHFLNRKTEATNVEAMIGQKAVITKAVTSLEFGEARMKGMDWTVALAPGAEELREGDTAVVEAVEGVKLIVRKES